MGDREDRSPFLLATPSGDPLAPRPPHGPVPPARGGGRGLAPTSGARGAARHLSRTLAPPPALRQRLQGQSSPVRAPRSPPLPPARGPARRGGGSGPILRHPR